ncbi:MAG: DNA polymerase I [Chloroflexi bacterium]|nr:DNA polymerase I [Chloroflexota bacterium]MCI0576458.1 DNA polymerase I [Chloroflexota bacterium]MCI0649566.1 DNA polymerase I [Chloroflexota bacterium]MCI0729358.1 DNA polymerase I [Chloroflexota bacterium]
MEQLVLIDGHALAYRAFYALSPDVFTTKAGEPTNATFGFTRTLLELLLAPDPPKYLAVSFDVGATFRDELFSEYKGTRAKMPGELDVQIGRIRQVVKAFNIPILELDGYEADDVLGTVARQARQQGVPVYIITGDRDLLQLVDENTRVELPAGRQEKEPAVFNEAAVIEKYGVRPDQIVDYKALIGDTSDNIPGVAGIGEKTAVTLLQEFGTLDAIYENLDKVSSRFRSKLEEGRESAYLSQKLARIITDAPVQLNLPECVAEEYDPAAVLELFRELEFRSLTGRITGAMDEAPDISDQAPTETVVVHTEKELAALVQELEKAEEIAFDVETTSLNEQVAELVGISLAVEPSVGYYVPVGHLAGAAQNESGQMALFAGEARPAEGQLALKKVLDALRPALTNPKIPKIAHNAKYDYAVLARAGLEVAPLGFDTMIAEWLCDPASRFLGLKDLAFHRLGVQMTNIEEVIGRGKEKINFAEAPIDQAAPYAAADADMTLRLAHKLRPEISEKGLDRLLTGIEMPLVAVLAAMEKEGVGIDADFFRQMSKELDARLVELERQIYDLAGGPFNINSTQQLSDTLFKKLKLPHEGLRRTQSGHYSTAADVLDSLRLADETGIIACIVEYRELGKLKSTYVDALPAIINPRTGRIHTSYSQTGAITGRIASSGPNLQNIPIRTEVGQQIRRGFVARPGHVFLAADYSQVELRILAHVTGDEALVEAFRQEQDIHRATAAAVYSVSLEAVTPNQRRFAKVVNFGLIYGMGAYRLARDSELTLAEAEQYIATYFARFPGIRLYLEETKQQARQKGYVETLLGRRRYFPIFQTKGQINQQAVARADREAVNHPIQGTAADIIKIAMIRLHQALVDNYRARLILQVHDELVLEMPEEEVDEVRPVVVEIMCDAFSLDVPLKVETSVGRNWLELKE